MSHLRLRIPKEFRKRIPGLKQYFDPKRKPFINPILINQCHMINHIRNSQSKIKYKIKINFMKLA